MRLHNLAAIWPPSYTQTPARPVPEVCTIHAQACACFSFAMHWTMIRRPPVTQTCRVALWKYTRRGCGNGRLYCQSNPCAPLENAARLAGTTHCHPFELATPLDIPHHPQRLPGGTARSCEPRLPRRLGAAKPLSGWLAAQFVHSGLHKPASTRIWGLCNSRPAPP